MKQKVKLELAFQEACHLSGKLQHLIGTDHEFYLMEDFHNETEILNEN